MHADSGKGTVDYRFKIIYALGMTMVVLGHIPLNGGISVLLEWFPPFGFHLALFAFSSGYFYRSENEGSVLRYIRGKIRKLIIPLYIYNIAYGLFVQATRLKGFEIGGDLDLYNILVSPVTNGHQFEYNMGGWFIIPLFMVQVFSILLRKSMKKVFHCASEPVFFMISLALGITGNQLACMGYYDGWWLVLVRMLYFLPFYALGILYKTGLEQQFRRIPNVWYFAVIFLIKLAIAYHYGKTPIYFPSWCKNFTEGPVMPVITGFLGIAFCVRIAAILEPATGRSRCVNLIADNTYSIMMNQFLGFMIVKTVYAAMNRLFGMFPDFDWIRYKSDIWWFYMPGGLSQTLIIYAFAGLVFPILLQKGIVRLRKAAAALLKAVPRI